MKSYSLTTNKDEGKSFNQFLAKKLFKDFVTDHHEKVIRGKEVKLPDVWIWFSWKGAFDKTKAKEIISIWNQMGKICYIKFHGIRIKRRGLYDV